MLGNNEDLEAKIADGTISIEEYNGIKPLLKTLLGDSSIVQNASRAAGDQLDIYNRNNPTKKILSGDSSNTQAAARQGGNALNTYNANNPERKPARKCRWSCRCGFKW